MADSNSNFILECNGDEYEYSVGTFTLLSKKCAELVKEGKYRGSISKPVTQETLEAFKNACHLNPFRVTTSNAFELLELAQEWQVSTLEKFVTSYIDNKGLKKEANI